MVATAGQATVPQMPCSCCTCEGYQHHDMSKSARVQVWMASDKERLSAAACEPDNSCATLGDMESHQRLVAATLLQIRACSKVIFLVGRCTTSDHLLPICHERLELPPCCNFRAMQLDLDSRPDSHARKGITLFVAEIVSISPSREAQMIRRGDDQCGLVCRSDRQPSEKTIALRRRVLSSLDT